MAKKLLVLTLLLAFVYSTNLMAKGEPLVVKKDLGKIATSVMDMESRATSYAPFSNFKNYILTGEIVGTSTLDFATAYFGRSIAVGLDGVVHIVWCTEGDPSYEVLYVRSTDGGETWSAPAEVHDGYYGYKPSIAVDPNDASKVYVAYVGYQNSGETRSIRVSASTDGGVTWGASVPAYGSVLDCNNPSIIVDFRGWVHIAFDNYTDTYTRYNYSTDGGQTWLSEPMVVSIAFAEDTFSAALAVDRNNNIHVLTGGGGTAGSWGDKGVYWTWLDMSSGSPAIQEVPPIELSVPGTGMPYPSMIFDTKNVGHLWYDNTGTSGWRDVFYKKYENGTWSEAEEIPSTQGQGACAASASIDADDNLYVMFHDILGFEIAWAYEAWPVDLVTGTNASGEWQYVNVTGDGQGVNQQYSDCASWVASDSILHIVYETGAAAPYQIVHEVGYPWPPEPTCGVNNLPDTYNTSGPFTIKATTGDVDGEVVGCTIHVWHNGEKIVEAEMTNLDKDKYEYTLTIEAAPNDSIEYQAVALDNDDYIGPSLVNKFMVLYPKEPKADLLIVENDARLVDSFWKTVREEMKDADGNPYVFEVWDVNAHAGIDESVTTFGWNTIFVHGWVVSSVPTRDYEGNAYAAFLNSGTEETPKNLALTSMDYFYAAGEPGNNEELVFEAGDFAYDFFGIAGGFSDPTVEDENGDDVAPDSVLLGVDGDPISGDFAETPLMIRPWATKDENDNEVTNYIDYTAAIEYDNDIFILESQGYGSGVKNETSTFKTVQLPWMICQLVQDTLTAGAFNVPEPAAITLVENILHWFGTDKGESTGGAVDHNVVNVDKFEVSQNYPNPFNPVTHIDYSVTNAVDVEMTVFNALGQAVKTLVNQKVAAGKHTVTWNGTNEAGQAVTSGTYFYRIKAGDVVKVSKMVLLK